MALLEAQAALDLDVYRRENLDLAKLADDALRNHFQECGWRERRVYAATANTREAMSMRWLRGRGLEVGAGDNPTPTFGDAKVEYGDTDPSLSYGDASTSHRMTIDSDPPDHLKGQFDFVVACHVLEHCDSLMRGIENMAALSRPDGVIYIILPDVRYLMDIDWMPNFDLAHHLEEWRSPQAFSALHDKQFTEALARGHSLFRFDLPKVAAEAQRTGRIAEEWRFVTHKHNYRFADWIKLLAEIIPRIDGSLGIEDAAFCRIRNDCHFIITRR